MELIQAEQEQLFVFVTNTGARFIGPKPQDVAKSIISGFDIALPHWGEVSIAHFMQQGKDGRPIPASSTNVSLGNGILYMKRSDITAFYNAEKGLCDSYVQFRIAERTRKAGIVLPGQK